MVLVSSRGASPKDHSPTDGHPPERPERGFFRPVTQSRSDRLWSSIWMRPSSKPKIGRHIG